MIRVNGEAKFVNDGWVWIRKTSMQWTTEQLAEFERNCVLFVERLFSSDEVEPLNAELPDILERPGPKNLTEQKNTSIRSAIAPHHSSDLFRRMSRHLASSSQQCRCSAGRSICISSRSTKKNAHDGEVWHWHQNYRTRFEDDGMPEPHVINAALFLDDVTEFNGPTMFVPGTH